MLILLKYYNNYGCKIRRGVFTDNIIECFFLLINNLIQQ